MNQDQKHPIVAGLSALVVVAVIVGAIAGIGILVGTKVAGLGAGTTSAKDVNDGASLYAPAPSPTKTPTGALVSLLPSPGEKHRSSSTKSASAPPTATPSPSKSAAPKSEITLQADSPHASPMQMVDLTGIYPGGEGAILRLERNDGSGWQEFGIPDVRVTGEQFATKIQTGRLGDHQFRMRDIDSHKTSNVITVTIG